MKIPPFRLHYAPDNASLIIRLALEELSVPYDTVRVDRAANAHKSDSYLLLNPNGLIPVLETPHGPIFETGAILLWLADDQKALFPQVGNADRADALKWLFFVSNTVHSAMRTRFHLKENVGGDLHAAACLRQTNTQQLFKYFQVLNEIAAGRKTWFNGSTPSILDLYVVTCLRWCALYPIDDDDWFTLTDTPALAELAHRIEARASVKAAILAEGLGETPLSAPQLPTTPQGSAH